MLPGCLSAPASLFLQPVQPAVLAAGLALRLLHPLDEKYAEEDQPDDVARAPQQAAGDVLVVQRRRRPGPAEAGVPVLRDQRVRGHDRDAEEGVERQREEDQHQPERVDHPAGHRIEPEQRPEEQRADQDEVQVEQIVQRRPSAGWRRTSR